jgi:transporter family-2 protein
MTGTVVAALLAAAGVALVAQNLLMAQMTAQTSTILVPLVMNSAVGLIALSLLLLWRNGLAGLGDVLSIMHPASLLPGLLGSFFVFASIAGYQKLGAAATISILVASQLIFGLAVDLTRSGAANPSGFLSAILGVMLLLAGVLIIAFRNV